MSEKPGAERSLPHVPAWVYRSDVEPPPQRLPRHGAARIARIRWATLTARRGCHRR